MSNKDREAKEILSGRTPDGAHRSGGEYWGKNSGDHYSKQGNDLYAGNDIYQKVGNSIYKNGSYHGETD